MKKKKYYYISEIDEEVLRKDEKNAENLLREFKPNYDKYFKKIQKENVQVRSLNAEVLLHSIIIDSKMPPYMSLGILESLKSKIGTIQEVKEEKKYKEYIG